MSALPRPADRFANRLTAMLHELRGLRDAAAESHALNVDHSIAPETGCVPDMLEDLIGTIEAQLREAGARVPAERRAAA